MVIFVPAGDPTDPTRLPALHDDGMVEFLDPVGSRFSPSNHVHLADSFDATAASSETKSSDAKPPIPRTRALAGFEFGILAARTYRIALHHLAGQQG